MRGGALAGLNLTDAQKTKIAEIREKGAPTRTDLQKQLARLAHEMRGEMLEDSPDRRKIVGLAESAGNVRTRLAVHRTEQMLEMREVLTPEQRDRWMMPSHRGGMRGHGGMRHGHGGGRGMGQDGPAEREPDGDEI
jgi:Spy/CpxP family protein refolding chaperone